MNKMFMSCKGLANELHLVVTEQPEGCCRVNEINGETIIGNISFENMWWYLCGIQHERKD